MSIRFTLYVATSIVVISVLTACGGVEAADRSVEAPAGLGIVVGVHQGGLAPGLPGSTKPLLQATLDAGKPISVVAVDGTPHAVDLKVPPVNQDSEAEHGPSLAHATNTVLKAVNTAKADADHANLLDAISLASDTLPAGADRGTIMVLDNGISDIGVLDLTVPGMLSGATKPDVVAQYVAETTEIDLTGVRIQLIGLGGTKSPQPMLSATETSRLRQLWRAVLTKVGATVEIDPSPRTNNVAPKTDFTTKPAAVLGEDPFRPPGNCTTSTHVYDESKIAFMDDSNELIDPGEARQAIGSLVDWLGVDTRRSVNLYGTTASAGDEHGRKVRSEGRAATVEKLLVKAGVDANQIGEVQGLGMNFPGYVNDRLPDGGLDPVRAAANRTTRIEMRGSC